MSFLVRRIWLAVVLAGSVVAVPACNNNDSTNDGSTTSPTPFQTTETFNGTLQKNGAQSHSFTISASGTVTVTLTKLADSVDSNLPAPNVGISLGSWDGTACAVQTGIFTDNASQGAQINGSVTGAGVLCTRIYDPNSNLNNPLSYTITVVHP
jgi:hypothetical protein